MPDKVDRKKLTIVSGGEIQKIPKSNGQGTWEKLPFKATDGQTIADYYCAIPALFQYIKAGAVIDCDIETKVNGEFTNRKIVQIYVDGKPVAGEKKQFQSRGDSPETRASIERQTCLKCAIDFLKGDEATLNDILECSERFYQWLSGKPPTAFKIVPAPTEQIPPNDARKPALPVTPVKEVSSTTKSEGQPTEGKIDLKDMEFKTLGAFYTACWDNFRLDKSKADKEYSGEGLPRTPEQYKKAWLQICEAHKPKEIKD